MSDDGTTVACPVEGCAFRDTASLVAAHLNGSEDPDHDWNTLRFGGPRDFLQQARRGWLSDEDETESTDSEQSVTDDRTAGSGDSTTEATGETTSTADEDVTDAGADATDAGPIPFGQVRCPADGCHYTGELASVKAHVSGTHDVAHDSERLRERGIYPSEADVKGRSGSAESSAGTDSTADPPTATDDTATATATDDTRITGDTTVSGLLDLLDAADSGDALPVDPGAISTALVFCTLLPDLADDPDTRTLVDAYTLASDLSSEAGDARTDLRDELLDRTDADGELAGEVGTVRRVTRTRRQLKDDDAVLGRLREAGVDTESVLRPDSKRVQQTLDAANLPESLAFDVTESSYVQKSDSDADAKEARLAALRRRSEE